MSYIREIKNLELTKDTSNSSQIISTTYTELDGSRISYTPKISSGNIIISFSQHFNSSPDADTVIQQKFQESTDNFVSNINDISGSHLSIKSLGTTDSNYVNGLDGWFYESSITLESWSGKKYFRVMLKSDSASSEFTVQKTHLWNSVNGQYATIPVLITIKEV